MSKLDPASAKMFAGYAEMMRDHAEYNINQTLHGLELCGSPLERKFLIYFLGWNGGCDNIHWSDDRQRPQFILENQYDGFVRIEPQCPISIDGHNYRADFLLTYKSRYPLTTRAELVVEIDGHAFHERTKEQAMHDRFRDRLMLAHGYTVMRFTGAEIYRDCDSAVHEVRRYLHRLEIAVAESRGFDLEN